MLTAQQEHVDHGPRSCLLASSMLQHLPKTIETGRPTPLCPPLLERCRTRQGSGLLRQCFQVMFQVEHFLLSVEAALVPRHTLSLVPDLYVRRVHLGLHFKTDRQGNRIEVGQYFHTAARVHVGEADRSEVETFLGQPAQMFPFQVHPHADRLRPPVDHPLLVALGSLKQQDVQFLPAVDLRYGHQVIPAKVTAFSLHATFFVPFSWCAELRLEAPMRSEGDESGGLLSLVSSQNLLHGTREVVITAESEYAAKIAKRPFVRFQKRLLTCMWEGAMERSSAGHAPQAEHIGQLSLSTDIREGFIPVHLRFRAPRIRLGNERLVPDEL